MRKHLPLCLAVLGLAAPAAAQPRLEGRYLLVGTLSGARPFDGDVAPAVFPAGFLARTPKNGFRPTLGLNWFNTDLREGGRDREIGDLRVRPVMAGLNFTRISGRVAVNVSAVAGYSFNRARASAAPAGGTTLQFSAKNSFAARPALSFIVTLSPRWAFYAGGGVLFVDAEIGLATLDASGRTVRTETGTWKANSVVWGVGIGRSIF